MGRNKRKAELQFDKTAEPISLSSFVQSLRVENYDIDLDLERDDQFTNTIDLDEHQSESPIDEIVPCISVAYLSNINNDFEEEYGLDKLFEYHFENLCDTLDVNSTNILELNDLSLEEKRIEFATNQHREQEKFDNQLFIERRLFQSLQLLNQIDRSYCDAFFPISRPNQHARIDQYFNDDDHGLMFLRNVINTKHDLIYKDQFKVFDKFKENNLNYECLTVANRILNESPELLKRRNVKIKTLDKYIEFSRSDFTIESVFNQIGIYFFSSYCRFNDRKKYIANFVLNRLNEIIRKQKYKFDKMDVFR